MTKHADDKVPADGTERVNLRRAPRHPVHIRALLHKGSSFQTTTITDLSSGGAGLESAVGIFPADMIEIELMDGRRIAGKVSWWLMGCCGVQFLEELASDDPLLINYTYRQG